MNAATARAVAYVCGRMATGRPSNHVYDYTARRSFPLGGAITASRIDVYDYDQRCHISGPRRAGTMSLYHYGNHRHISITPMSTHRFNGYDYATSKHFSATVNGTAISLYDHGNGQWRTYSI